MFSKLFSKKTNTKATTPSPTVANSNSSSNSNSNPNPNSNSNFYGNASLTFTPAKEEATSIIFGFNSQELGIAFLEATRKVWLIRESSKGLGYITIDFRGDNTYAEGIKISRNERNYCGVRLAFVPDENGAGKWVEISNEMLGTELAPKNLSNFIDHPDSIQSLFTFLAKNGFDLDDMVTMSDADKVLQKGRKELKEAFVGSKNYKKYDTLAMSIIKNSHLMKENYTVK